MLELEGKMDEITLDDALRAKLNGLTRQVQVRDESGKRVGVFVPAEDFRILMTAVGDAIFTPEEEEEAAKQTGGRPLADIWKDLGRT
jgi:hypothetical protein